MDTKIISFKSPLTQKENKIAIFTPKNAQGKVNIFIFFDGQIFKTKEKGFDQYDGIEVFKHLENNTLENSVIVLVSSMNNVKNKYKTRQKELDFEANVKTSFLNEALEKINPYLQKYKNANFFGFGFSLSGIQILLQQKKFDHVVSISPSKKVKRLKNIHENASVYYGQKEYVFRNNKRVLKPLNVFKKNNPSINVIKYTKMKHTFSSWNDHFDHILKSSIVPFLHFQKAKIQGIGKFIHDGSNISFVNKNKHLKIHFNKVASMKNEINFINKTKYAKDYEVLSKNSYLKTYYEGVKRKMLSKKDVLNLVKELNDLHSLPIAKKIPKFNYGNEFDKDTFVMSHGDINEKNVVFSQAKCYFIDFEWAMLHSLYWDIASIFYKFNLNKEQQNLFLKNYFQKNINKDKINKMIKIVKKVEKDFFKNNKDYFVTRV